MRWQKIRTDCRSAWFRTGRFFRGIYIWGLYRVALRYRNRKLSDIFFIAVTGSAGKTTAKDYAVAVLSKIAPAAGNFYTHNSPEGASLSILRAEPTSRFFVSELGIAEIGDVKKTGRLVRPRITAVTNIGYDHYRQFRSLEAIAEEKRFLVEILPRDGLAVLNADDPHVRAMAEHSPAPVLLFGRSDDADLRATDITGVWPQRFAMTVSYRGETARVETRLVGRHWASPVLAAIGVGLGCRVPLADCADAVAEVEPEFNRLSSHTSPDGVSFLLDAYKAPFWSIDLAFEAVQEAVAGRKIIVLGTMSDLHGDTKSKYRRTIRSALEIADLVVFTGPLSNTVRRGLTEADDARLNIFATVYEASRFVNDTLRGGDLVLLKGSAASDHLERIYLDRLDRIACWREHCGKKKPCMRCWHQRHEFVPRQARRRAAALAGP